MWLIACVDGMWSATQRFLKVQKSSRSPTGVCRQMNEGGETADEQEPNSEDESEAGCRIERAGTHMLKRRSAGSADLVGAPTSPDGGSSS
ncbi:hypothetical protein ON010_g4142 [Phytophthora cinnamomi]|nr:hypothetical protein ON010_g4142 [Phytophthora cinnamomi]